MSNLNTVDWDSIPMRLYALGAIARTAELELQASDEPDLFDTLENLKTLRFTLDQTERAVVAALRANGTTWEAIGTDYGISPQAAQKRFGG